MTEISFRSYLRRYRMEERSSMTLSKSISRLELDLIDNFIQLFVKFKRISEIHFIPLYELVFKKTLDLIQLGYKQGLKEVFAELNETIELVDLKNNIPIYGLKDIFKASPNPVKARSDKITLKKIFESKFNEYLNYDVSSIVKIPSAFEAARYKSPKIVDIIKDEVARNMDAYPDGVKVSHLRRILNVHDLRRLFGVPIGDIIQACPEMFYLVEPEDESDERIVFSGKTNNYQDFGISVREPERLAIDAIRSEIYQKTLLLLRKYQDGIKLVVWYDSVATNFGTACGQTPSLELALALKSEGLINLKPGPDGKNDLRIYCPSNLRVTLNNIEKLLNPGVMS